MSILIYANWKMNLGPSEAVKLFRQVGAAKLNESVKVSYFPSMVSVYPVFKEMESTENYISGKTSLGVQNCDWRVSGAVTGETSAEMLKGLCSKVLVGHSERRQLFGESEAIINKKIARNMFQNLTSVLCVGESSYSDRGNSEANRVLEGQLHDSLKDIDLNSYQVPKIVVAYEPIWAVGTGQAASPTTAYERCGFLKDRLKTKYGKDFSDQIPILYGGSVNKDNARSYLQLDSVDGLLIGGASLDAVSFTSIIQIANDVADEKCRKG